MARNTAPATVEIPLALLNEVLQELKNVEGTTGLQERLAQYVSAERRFLPRIAFRKKLSASEVEHGYIEIPVKARNEFPPTLVSFQVTFAHGLAL